MLPWRMLQSIAPRADPPQGPWGGGCARAALQPWRIIAAAAGTGACGGKLRSRIGAWPLEEARRREAEEHPVACCIRRFGAQFKMRVWPHRNCAEQQWGTFDPTPWWP